MDKSSRIYVAGHGGLVGSAICRRLRKDGYSNLIVRDRGELDLFERPAVDAFFAAEKPEYVFLAAARVGGILANSTYPVEFLRDNLSIELNVMDAAYRYGVKKIEILGSSCIYPQAGAAADQGRVSAHGAAWSRPMNGTPSPKSRASSWRRRTGNNTGSAPSA